MSETLTENQATGGTPNPDSAARTDSIKAEQVQKPKPNVVLAHAASPVTVNGPINMGTITVDVPSEAEQRAGWYDPNAAVLINQYPKTYKHALGMGQSAHIEPFDLGSLEGISKAYFEGFIDDTQRVNLIQELGLPVKTAQTPDSPHTPGPLFGLPSAIEDGNGGDS